MTTRLAAEAAGFLTAAVSIILVLLLAGRFLPEPAIATICSSVEPHLSWSLAGAGVVFLLLRRWLRGVAAIALAAAFMITLNTGLAAHRTGNALDAAPGDAIRLISFNVLGENAANAGPITGMLTGSTADIAIILEARALEARLGELAAAFPHRAGCDPDTRICDLALFSRHPLEAVSISNLSATYPNRLITARTTVRGQTVTIVAAHLTKPFHESVQHHEFRRIARTLDGIEGPVILAGDFNSAPWTPDFLDFLETTGLKLAPQSPATWPVALAGFGIPIDHMLVRGQTGWFDLEAIDDAMGSNHRGLRAAIGFTADTPQAGS